MNDLHRTHRCLRVAGALLVSALALASACTATVDDGDLAAASHALACPPGEEWPCYSAPLGTDGIGACQRGVKTCDADGSGYGACTGEVVPTAEQCNGVDDDCNGVVDDGCPGGGEGGDPGEQCPPGEEWPCYSAPLETDGIGACQRGVKTCDADGFGYGACVGEVAPTAEQCNGADDDCNGVVDDGCPGGGEDCGDPGEQCPPGEEWTCYSAPLETDGIGACQRGVKTCDADGFGYGACVGEVVPSAEICGNTIDEDCDGAIDDDCCELPALPATCAEGFHDGNRYAICQGSRNVPESETACAALGMHLAFVDTEAENTWLVDTALAAFGYSGYAATSYWIANTKTSSPMLPWAAGEPNNPLDDCIHILRYIDQPYRWNDAHCVSPWRWGWVCEGPSECDPGTP